MLNSFGQAIANAANQGAETTQTVINGAGDAVADGAETLGNAIEDGANAAGGAMGGGAIQAVMGWLGNTAAGAGNFVGASIKGVFGVVAGVAAGVIRIIGGALAFNGDLIVRGLGDIGFSIVGAAICWGGTLLGFFQRTFFLQNNDRPLTKTEKEMLRKVFKNSISLYNVRVVEGNCGLLTGDPQRPFTLGNTVYFKQVNPNVRPDLLVHECVHVWQYQHFGGRYSIEAIVAMKRFGDSGPGSAYDWVAEPGRGHTDWNDFNREAQAQLIQDVWTDGNLTINGSISRGNGSFYDLEDALLTDPGASAVFLFRPGNTDYSQLATDAIHSLRGNTSWRLSRNS